MGLFDNVFVFYPLPDTKPDWINFETMWQTKDTDAQYLEDYVITEEGRLIHKTVRYESVPEEERPYYGKPEWETSPLARFCGIITRVPIGDIDTNFHGDLRISAMTNAYPYKFYECVCRFTNGQLEYIKEMEKQG